MDDETHILRGSDLAVITQPAYRAPDSKFPTLGVQMAPNPARRPLTISPSSPAGTSFSNLACCLGWGLWPFNHQMGPRTSVPSNLDIL